MCLPERSILRWMSFSVLVTVHCFGTVPVCDAQQAAASRQERPIQQTELARVSGQVINEEMVDAYCEKQIREFNTVDPQLRFYLRRGVLSELVQRELALKRLLELGGESLSMRISQAERQFEEGRQGADFDVGLGLFERRELVWSIAWSEYLTKQMTQENLAKFFQFRRSWFDGTSVHLSQIFVPKESPSFHDVRSTEEETLIRSIKQQIVAGELTFSEAASRYSRSPSASSEGVVGWVKEIGDLPTPVLRAALDGEIGECIGPVRSRLGWHLLQLQERIPGSRSFEQLEDQSGLRRAAADFLFERLVSEGSQDSEVIYVSPQWKLPDAKEVSQ